MTPYYQDETVTIYHADFREVLPTLTPPHLTVADPPYGQTSLAWDRWVDDWPMGMGLGAAMWVFGTLRMFMDHADEFRSWRMSQDVVWEKHNGSSLATDRFSRVHEQAVHFYRGEWRYRHHTPPRIGGGVGGAIKDGSDPGLRHLGKKAPRTAYSPDGTRLMRSVIQVRSAHGYAENETQKPVGILTPLIEYGCPPGGLVLDPFMGSGSTLIASRDSGRRAIGIDVREDQCEIAARRAQWLAA